MKAAQNQILDEIFKPSSSKAKPKTQITAFKSKTNLVQFLKWRK